MHRIDTFLQHLVESGGSDLHLSEGQRPKIRVHGAISEIPEQELLEGESFVKLLAEICDEKPFQRYLETGDLDFAYSMDEQSRFRCNYLKQKNGLAAVFRLIPTEIAPLEALGVPAVVKQFGEMRSGLVLVTGPTGSGKSTTLAALLDYINSNFNRHIITVEEPIEFVHSNKRSIITQREVPIHTPSFADGLRASLREDSDIVLVGEMRDLETISLALTASETGLLVFGTLHTNNAAKTIDRIIDAFPADEQNMVRMSLAESLAGIVSQLLLPTADGKGRCAANEILLKTPGLPNVIREGNTQMLYSIIQSGRGQGMQAMDDVLWDYCEAGKISANDAFMKASDKPRFEPLLKD